MAVGQRPHVPLLSLGVTIALLSLSPQLALAGGRPTPRAMLEAEARTAIADGDAQGFLRHCDRLQHNCAKAKTYCERVPWPEPAVRLLPCLPAGLCCDD